MDCLAAIVPEALRQAGLRPDQVVGIGIDITANTMFPVNADGTPLCFEKTWRSNPYAYGMLWKHHAAQRCAEEIAETARARGEAFLKWYGGSVSAEWMMPKILQIVREAPEVYEAADQFTEAGDWIVWRMTGRLRRSAAMAGYKAFYRKDTGWPDEAFYRALDPRLARFVPDKLRGGLYPMGQRAGTLTPEAAKRLGLRAGTPVAVANIDAHVSMPAVGAAAAGSLVMIIGTSTCHIMISDKARPVPGIGGMVEDGVVPGAYGYEAGQSCVGDSFRWLVENALPGACADAGTALADLTQRASRLRPGESGLVALDWWNGNRSILVDMDLSGLIVGLTLDTKPEAIFRALVEATAYGTRRIVENFEENGLPVERLYACGGIAHKNPMMMQIYADVLNRPIQIGRSAQAPALGSAMFGAVAAGAAEGGWDDIAQASAHMSGAPVATYAPKTEAAAVYERLYAEYLRLHDWFGRGGCDVMKQLRRIRQDALRGSASAGKSQK